MVHTVNQIEQRKKEHLALCINKDVSFKEKTTLLECVELGYNALPEISYADVDLSTEFLGKKFSFPYIVSAMTGGAQVAKKVNKDVALACQELGIGMGVGSMRAMLVQPSLTETYYVRDVAPDIFLAGNIGAAQLKQYSPKEINAALEGIEASALAIHINAAQEAMQPEGDLDFTGVIAKIAEYADTINVPVYVKEVGHGISYEVALALKDTKIFGYDVQGAGGTSWTYIEALRKKKSSSIAFRDFGTPTAVSLIEVKNAVRGTTKKIVASGGIRNGIDATKALVMGADMVGAAMPVLQAQDKKGTKGIVDYLNGVKEQMQISSFLLGCKNINDLHKQHYVVTGKLKEWLKQ